MNRESTLFAQALVALGNVALVHSLPPAHNLWQYDGTVHVHVHAADLPAWRSALRGDPIASDDERKGYGGTERVSTKATLPNGAPVEVHAYQADD